MVCLLVQGRTLDTARLLTCATFSYTPLFVCVKLARTGHSWPKESLHALNRFVFCASPQHCFLTSSVTLSILSQSNSNWIGCHQFFLKLFQALTLHPEELLALVGLFCASCYLVWMYRCFPILEEQLAPSSLR